MSIINSFPKGGEAGTGELVYDFRGTEIVVGKVIEADGTKKKLYQISGEYKNNMAKGAGTPILNNFTNKAIIEMRGVAKESGGAIVEMPSVGSNFYHDGNNSIYVYNGGNYPFTNLKYIIRYTKTTD